MFQAFLAWDTSHVFSMGSCYDDHRQPGAPPGPTREDAPRRSSDIPCVRTTAPGFRRRRTPPSLCHSLRADNRARASSRTHLRPRARPPRVQTARLRLHPRAPGTLIQQAVTYDGDIPRGRVRVTPGGDIPRGRVRVTPGGGIRRRRGQHSRPRARRMPPAATPESGRRAPPALTGRGGLPLSQQPGAFGEDRQVHPVTGTDPLLRTAQVGLDG